MLPRKMRTAIGHKGLEPLLPNSLQPHSDLSFRILDGLTIEDTNIRQSLLNGCMVRNCTFRGVNLARCDLEQMQFLDCRFLNVDFGNVELTSTQLAKCRFEHCSFESALITECVWRGCVIEHCAFTQSVIQASQFEECQLLGNNLRGASIQLDAFRRCSFEAMTLGDCTFLNQLLIDCRYRDVCINAESIGSLFGVSAADLAAFDLIYLGQPVVELEAKIGLLDALEEDYEKRRWYFMREMLRLNFGRRSRAVALDGCLEAVLWPASFGAPLKGGDITFLEMVILELFQRKQLPGVAALGLPERIKEFQQGAKLDPNSAEQKKLQQLSGRLRNLLLEMLRELEPALASLATNHQDKRVTARLVFESKPATDVVRFVRQSTRDAGLKVAGTTVRLREETGSYIVVLQTTLVSLAAFQTALWLLNGCVAQMIELKSRSQIMMQKRAPLVIKKRVLLPEQHVPKWMTGAIQGLFLKLTGGSPAIDQAAGDFGPESLRKVEVEAAPASRRPRKRSPDRS